MKNSGKLTKLFFVFYLAFFALVSITAHAQTETPPAPAQPRSVTIPKPVEKTLSNNLRVIVVERRNVPLVSAQLLVKSGGESDPQGLAGVANMTAGLLTKGTKTRTAEQIAEQFESLGGSIYSGANWDASSVSFQILSNKLDKAMEITGDVIANPIFSREEIDRFKAQNLDRLNVSLKQPGTLTSYVANRVVFGSKAYGHPLGGTPESINRITRDYLVKFHQDYYQPGNVVLVIAGDVAPNAVFAIAEKHLGAWKGAKTFVKKQLSAATQAQPKETLQIEKITVIDLPNSGQAAVSVAQSSIPRSDAAYFRGLVANSVLGGGYSARLGQEIRIKRGLSYGAGSSLSARQMSGIFAARTQTKNGSAAEVAEIMVNEFNRLAREPIAETEPILRKAVLIGGFSRSLETTGGIVEQIAQLALYDLDLNEINRFIQNVQNISDEQTRQFMQSSFASSKTNVVIVGDASKFLPDLQKRFSTVKVDVIPASELDLNTSTLRKPATPNGSVRSEIKN